MRYNLALLPAIAALAAAQHHHGHLHHNAEKRDADATTITVAGPTEIAYVLNGHAISAAEVEEGIRNGTLRFEGSEGIQVVSSSTAASATTAPTSSSVAESSSTYEAPWSSSAPVVSIETSSASAPSSTSAAAVASTTVSSAASSGSSSSSSWSGSSSGVSSEFPDGELDCSTFPSEYGAVAVDWLDLGGWTGVQSPGSSSSSGFSDIETITTSTCGSSGCCSEGMYCSYACPAGYEKTQWPTTQGSTGQSVGGLLCENGKLKLTNSALSTSLCATGASEVTVLVENKLSSNVAICRTDYPGTESETVPVDVAAGETTNLTCPDASNYYTWKGSQTSAQYYVNPAGVSVSDACQWGEASNPWGNFAPLNLGIGYSAGAAWLAIFQNSPTTDAKLAFSVEITGDGISGTCKYSNGEYCSGENYDSCSSTTGCTVSITSGTATFILSD